MVRGQPRKPHRPQEEVKDEKIKFYKC